MNLKVPILREISSDIPETLPGKSGVEVGDGLLRETEPLKEQWFVLPGNEMSITESARRIFSVIGETHTLFYRGGAVVEIVGEGGKVEFEAISDSKFCSRMERYDHKVGSYVIHPHSKEAVLKTKACTVDKARQLLASLEASEYLPQVSGISNCDILIEYEEGTKVLSAGYHPECGGIYVAQKREVEKVSWEEGVDAVRAIMSGFDFRTEADLSRAIASLITPALRFGGHINSSIPVDVAEANESQSGKTYRQKVIAAVYAQTPEVVTQVKGVGGGDEPFFNALCRGKPFIQFDNVRNRVDSPSLEAFITANGEFGVRGAYKKWGAVDSRHFFLMLTSNGFESTRDLMNRSNIIRIRKRPEDYAYTQYAEGDLLDHVKAHQGYYLGCIFSILREWVRRGKKRTNEKRHDFRDWGQVCDWIIQHIFELSPIMDGHEETKKRIASRTETWIRRLCLSVSQTNQTGKELSASDILDICDQLSIPFPTPSNQMDDDVLKRKIGSYMKKLFGEKDVLECEDYLIRRNTILSKRPDRPSEMREMKVYIFSLAPTTP